MTSPKDDHQNQNQREATTSCFVEEDGCRMSEVGATHADSVSITNQKPRWPEYESFGSRIQTFVGWPVRYYTQTPESFASAGFFYIGSGDRVRCFSCGITVRNWQKNDDPLVEHLRLSPRCRFVSDAVNEPVSANSRYQVPAETRTAASSTSFNPNSSYVQTVIKMGFTEDEIRKVINENNKNNVAKIVEEIMKIRLNIANEVDVQNGGHSTSNSGGKTQRDSCEKSTTEKNSALKDEKGESRRTGKPKCKKCNSEAVILCLPCGHISCCEACVNKTKSCFFCGDCILGTVRTYLS